MIRMTGQWITAEMMTCGKDAEASYNRYAAAVEDATNVYQRNIANVNLLINTGIMFKHTTNLLHEVLTYMDTAPTSQEWRADTMAKINQISIGQAHLDRTCMDIHGGRNEAEIRDTAIAQAEAKYIKETADLNSRWNNLDSMSKIFLTRLEHLTTKSS